MRKTLLGIGLTVAIMATLLAMSVPAGAVTIDVFPGESIQDAVHAASPGDTIMVHAGVYTESVSIRKDGIKLIGEGATDAGTVLQPGPDDTRVCGHGAFGICVFARSGDRVKGVRISGIKVEDFPVFGIIGVHTRRLVIEENFLLNDGEYGAASFDGLRTRMTDNTARENLIGLYIGDTRRARADITGNILVGNRGYGLFVRSAAIGTISGNTIRAGCVGLFMLNEGTITPREWVIENNEIHRNNAFCRADHEHGTPALSGIGILIIAGDENIVRSNDIARNRRLRGFFSGGVVVVSDPNGGDTPDGNRVRTNDLVRNRPNIMWDGTGRRNVFANNRCVLRC